MILVHCDIDQTYLQTDFHSFRGLLRVVTEKASDKKTFPYATETLQILSNQKNIRLRFLSASPEQMRRVLEKKIQMDGISFDEVFLKNATSMVMSGTIRGVLNQVSYKLPVLLQSFLQCIEDFSEQAFYHLLFGDDSEDDPIIYTIFEAIVNKKISYNSPVFERILESCSIHENDILAIQEISQKIQQKEYRTKVIALIHMTGNGPIEPMMIFPPFVIPVLNWLQIALFIQEAGIISREELNMITKTTSSFSIQGNKESLERVLQIPVETYFSSHRSQVQKEKDNNKKELPKHQRVHHSLFDIIQIWRKQ